MNYRKAFIIALLISVANLALTQELIKGRVYDSRTLEPLHGVYVIYGKNQGTTTSSDGSFGIKTDSRLLNIKFQFIGYKSVEKSISVDNNNKTELEIGLDMDLQEIGQIVISADKNAKKIAELTVSMAVIKPAEFLKSHINDAQELISKTPGIEVIDGQASVRGGSGFSYGVGSRVLALIDGLPVLSPDAGSIKWQFLPLENISQIEIIKGASSVLYGSSALNGVINFRTEDPSNTPVTRFFAESGIFGKPSNKEWVWWDTPRIFSSMLFSHLQKTGKNDIGIGINLMSDNGYRKLNDEKLGRVSFRFKHHNAKIDGLTYGLNINTGYTSKRDFLLWEDAANGALIQDTSTVSKLNGTFIAIDPYIAFYNKGKFKHDLRIRIQSSNNRFPVRDENNSDALSYYSEYQTNYKFSDLFGITAGISENYSIVRSNFFGDHDGLNLAGFAQIESNPLPRLKLVAGLRVEQNSLDGKKDKIVPNFRAGINWQLAEYTFLRSSFGQGYRYPSIAERFASTTLGSVKIYPNDFVKPESGMSSEIGLKQGLLIGETKGQVDLSVFLSQNSDLIEYVFGYWELPSTGLYGFGFQAQNLEQSRVYGYETEFTLNRSFGNLNTLLTGGYTYIYPVEFNVATNSSNSTFLKYRRKHSAKLSLSASFKKVEAGVDLFAKSKILNIDEVFLGIQTREVILPGFYNYWQDHNTGYFSADCNIGYQLNKSLTLSAAVKNITNTEYMGRPGDIQPHRNFSLRLSGKF